MHICARGRLCRVPCAATARFVIWDEGAGSVVAETRLYVDGKLDIDHPYNSLRNYTQSHKCPPACAHTPGPSRRPCLEFSRGFIGTTSINQVRECGDIILYYIMNYETVNKRKNEKERNK